MKKIILLQLQQAQNQARAYLCYGTLSVPTDHKGNPLGKFYDQAVIFTQHLVSTIVPMLSQYLNQSHFKIESTNFQSLSPQPYLLLSKTNQTEFTETELLKLRVEINKALDCFNHSLFKRISLYFKLLINKDSPRAYT